MCGARYGGARGAPGQRRRPWRQPWRPWRQPWRRRRPACASRLAIVVQEMPRTSSCNAGLPSDGSFSIAQRTMTPLHQAWQVAPQRTLPTFVLREHAGCNSTAERNALHAALGQSSAEAVLPNSWSQYLIDWHIVAALETSSLRVNRAGDAHWNIVAAAPFTSYVVGMLGLMGGRAAHERRMHELEQCLTQLPEWQQPVPFFLLQPYFATHDVLGLRLAQMLVQRNERVGPVVLGTVDRTHGRMAVPIGRPPHRARVQLLRGLFARAVELPYVATPELARQPSAGRLARPHTGFLFHGDVGRWDYGVRGAVRDISGHLRARAPVSFRQATLSRGDARTRPHRDAANTLLRPSLHLQAARNGSRQTADAMMAAALCFVPQGDTMTSRRLFDALAAGCTPIVMKCLGKGRTELAMGNLPFPHTIEWRALALFHAPRRTRQSDRETPARGDRMLCRREEAEWLLSMHANASLLEGMRSRGWQAFESHLDVEFRPHGLVPALLRELAHVLDETPAITWRTHPFTYPFARREYEDLNLVMPPPHTLRRPVWANDETPLLSRFTGDAIVTLTEGVDG